VSFGKLCRAIAPKRRWKRWGLAFVTSSLLVGLVWVLSKTEILHPGITLVSVALAALVAPALAVFFAGTLAPVVLFTDWRAGRLETLTVTNLHRLTLLRAYHRRALLTATLVLGVLAPAWVIVGRAPAPLLFSWKVLECHIVDTSWDTPLHFASGFLSDLFTAYLAAALGTAFLVLTRNRGWAMVLAWLGTLAFGAFGWMSGLLVAGVFKSFDVTWYKSAFVFGDPVEPGYSLLLWSFAIPYSLLAYLLARLILRLAARRLDRLVTD